MTRSTSLRILGASLVGGLVFAAVTLSPSAAGAAVVGFEGFGGNTIFGDENAGNGLAVATSDGFNFTSSGDHFHFGSGLAGVPSNGTSILLQDRNYVITMTQVGGGAFSLASAGLGEDVSFVASALAITVTGFFSGGGSISTTVTLDGNAASFQNAVFAGFTNLSSVTFDGINNPSASVNANGFTLDNIVTAEVPEPGTMALLAGSLVAFVAARRRRAA